MSKNRSVQLGRLLRWGRKYCTSQGVMIRAFFNVEEGGFRLEMKSGSRSWAYCFGVTPPNETTVKIHVEDACIGFFR